MRCWEGVARIRSGLVAPGEMEAREKDGRRGEQWRALASRKQLTVDGLACGQCAVKYLHKIYLYQPYAPCGRAARTSSERRAEDSNVPTSQRYFNLSRSCHPPH